MNGAAKFHGHSFNNALLTVPDLLQSLFTFFRDSDETNMPCQLTLKECFSKLVSFQPNNLHLVFLWPEDPATDGAVYQYARHIVDSRTCANYALKQNATDNENFPEASHSLQNNFYMDDYLESSPTVQEATQKAQDLIKLLAVGGFSRTWTEM